MSARRKRKPGKIYRTTITLKPPSDKSDPAIEIDTTTLRPKLIKPKPGGPLKRLPPTTPAKGQKEFKRVKRYDEALIQRREWVPVTRKTRWKCIRCGWCCTHQWRVNLTWDEYDRLKDKLPIEEVVVDPKSGMSHPLFTIKDKCVQYDPKTHKCKIYKIRAYSCATFPFALTPEGKLVRSKFCNGFGKGEVIDRNKMRAYIMKWRKRAGMIV